jgi:hypothetical protein
MNQYRLANSSAGTGNIVTTDFSPLTKVMEKLSFLETTHIMHTDFDRS